MIIPELLKKGDKVGIVSPSRMITEDQVSMAIKTLQLWGLEVTLGEHLYNSAGYFAGTDEERAYEMQQMLDDREIKAIFCARGGYGATRIVDALSFEKFKENPKWLIGFSDITAFHLKLNNIGVESIHGLMPVQFEKEGTELSKESLYNVLFNGEFHYEIKACNHNILGNTKGELIGGNLSLLADSIGTDNEIDTNGKILFIEEIDEYLYKIDRMLTQLQRSGKFAELRGVIIGDFSLIKDTQIPFGMGVNELIFHHFKCLDIPVAFNVPVGHENYNLAIVEGREVLFMVDNQCVTIKSLPHN